MEITRDNLLKLARGGSLNVSELVGNVEEFCAPPPAPGEDIMDGLPCSAATPLATLLPMEMSFLASSSLRLAAISGCRSSLRSGKTRRN